MSLVDLSQYDKPTTNAQNNRGVELIDSHNGERRTIMDTGESSERLMVDFLRGRKKIDSIPKAVNTTGVEVRQDLQDLGMVSPEKEKEGNLLVRLVRELI